MDNLFTLIIIIIAVVSVISKIKAKQKTQQGATPPGGGGWITKLNDFLADIQNKMEQQPQEGATGASGWGQLLAGGEDANEEGLNDLVFEEEETPPRPKKKPPVPPGRIQKKRPDTGPVGLDIPRRSALCSERRAISRMAGNRADLRKAVIWSEILGPPVALKDQSSGRR